MSRFREMLYSDNCITLFADGEMRAYDTYEDELRTYSVEEVRELFSAMQRCNALTQERLFNCTGARRDPKI
jgi:hypothetical protein